MRGRLTLSILFFLGLCGSAWFNVQQHAQGLQDKKALSDQLATLKNQVQQQPVATPTPSVDPADAPLLAGQSRVSLSVFGANIIVVDPISDLVYGTVKYNGADTIGFTTQSLLAKYPGCKAGALGTLVRTKVSSTPKPTPTPTSSMSSFRTPSNQPFSKYLGNYLYTYRPTYSVCADDKSGEDALAADIDALKNQALPTISLQKPGASPSQSPDGRNK
jgi:hypothetical protein